MAELGLSRAAATDTRRRRERATFPSIAPVFALDRLYLRDLTCQSLVVPRGMAWARMSDHLPVVAELGLA
jgi:endonuclease/exonuclease/phosphatase family metal-dependent hydrolase